MLRRIIILCREAIKGTIHSGLCFSPAGTILKSRESCKEHKNNKEVDMPAILLRILARMLFTRAIKEGLNKLKPSKKPVNKEEERQLIMDRVMNPDDINTRGGMK